MPFQILLKDDMRSQYHYVFFWFALQQCIVWYKHCLYIHRSRTPKINQGSCLPMRWSLTPRCAWQVSLERRRPIRSVFSIKSIFGIWPQALLHQQTTSKLPTWFVGRCWNHTGKPLARSLCTIVGGLSPYLETWDERPYVALHDGISISYIHIPIWHVSHSFSLGICTYHIIIPTEAWMSYWKYWAPFFYNVYWLYLLKSKFNFIPRCSQIILPRVAKRARIKTWIIVSS